MRRTFSCSNVSDIERRSALMMQQGCATIK